MTEYAPFKKPIATKKEDEYLVPPMAADVIAAISTLVTGCLTFWSTTDERAHKNLSTLQLTEDIKEERKPFGVQLREKVVAGELTPTESRKAYQNAIHLYQDKMEDRFAKAGITNIWDKWSILRNHQKWAVAMTTFAAGGIALGSVLLLSREFVKRSDKENLFTKKVEKEMETSAAPER